MRGRLLAVGSCFFLVAPLILAVPASGKETASVTGAVQATDNPAPVRAHSSPQIAVDPKRGELVLVESDVRGSRSCNVHISADRGRSWVRGGDPMMKPFVDCGFYAEYGPYATLAFGDDGTLYIAFVASELLNRVRDENPRHVFLARSTDRGRSFATTRVFEAPDGKRDVGLNKGPMLAVDPSDPKRVYVGWRQGVFRDATEKLKSNIATSGDGGRTFGPAVDLTDERGGDYPGIAVDAKGTVHAVYWTRVWPTPAAGTEPPVRPIMYVRSTNRGKTFTKPREIDPGNQSASRPALLAADPRSGALYAVWHGNEDPKNQAQGFKGDLDVFVRSSVDGGKTWSERVKPNDERNETNQYEPGIAIAPSGRVDLAWYDFRNSPSEITTSTGHSGDRGLADVYYASSNDRGKTWRANLKVSDRGIDRSVGVWGNNVDSKFNVGVASTDAAVHFAWQDTRNAIHETGAEDIYTGSVQLTGAAATDGGTAGGIPAWALVGAGLALGMGIAVVLAWLVARRGGAGPQPAPAG
ncbi:MAG: sialidase family protein [Actinomycetota bacterium]